MGLDLQTRLRRKAAETSFSGAVSMRIDGFSHCEAFGFRDGPNQTPNSVETRFGTASVTKGFTALGIAGLIESGDLAFDTAARSIVGSRIANLNAEITIGQLLCHTSGIGDYLDEEKLEGIDQFETAIPSHKLISPLDYIPMLEAEPQKFAPGSRFSYSNSGYIVLSIIIELMVGDPYQDVIERRIFERAGMTRSEFFRADCLPENTATGYLSTGPTWHSNIFNLPIRGGGDGGAYTTVGDMDRFWSAFLNGKLVGPDMVAELLSVRVQNNRRDAYGYGFWLDDDAGHIALIGGRAGGSHQIPNNRSGDIGYTVISNTTPGAWPIIKLLDAGL
jgi:CubicO group peptidase (beta-lactamase class C family)